MIPDTTTPERATHATLTDIAALLRDHQARKLDIVAPAIAIHARSAQLVIDDSVPLLTADGVTVTAGSYTPTALCDQGIADKLGIPAAYLRRLRDEQPALYDTNVNGWLQRDDASSCCAASSRTPVPGRVWPGPGCPTATSSSTTWMC